MTAGRLRQLNKCAAAVAGILLGLLLSILPGCRTRSVTAAPAAGAPATATAVITEGDVVAPPGVRADVPAPYRAMVQHVMASVDADVRRGDPLVELYNPSIQENLLRAKDELKAAQLAYSRAERIQNARVAAAERALKAALLAEAEARGAPPAATDTLTPSAPVNAAAADTSTALTAAQAAQASAERAVAEAKAAREAALFPLRQRLEAARVALKEALQTRSQLALIRAPISGTVLALNAQPGKEIIPDPRTPVATIVDLNRLEAHTRLPDDAGQRVRAGQSALLHLRELPGEEFMGKVISVTTDPGRLLPVVHYVAIISVTNKDRRARPGMKAQVIIKPSS